MLTVSLFYEGFFTCGHSLGRSLGLEMDKQFLSSGCARRDKKLWSDLLSRWFFCSRVSPSTSHVPKLNTIYCSFVVAELLFCYEDLDKHSYLLCPCSQSAYWCAPGPYLCSFSSEMILWWFNHFQQTTVFNSLPCCQARFLLLLTTFCSSLSSVLPLPPIVAWHSDRFKHFCNLPLFHICIKTLCLIFKWLMLHCYLLRKGRKGKAEQLCFKASSFTEDCNYLLLR